MKKLIIGAASLMLCAGLQAQDFKINPSGYFENHGANVMVFSDVYPEGHQGGVTLVLNGDRRAAGGAFRDFAGAVAGIAQDEETGGG